MRPFPRPLVTTEGGVDRDEISQTAIDVTRGR